MFKYKCIKGFSIEKCDDDGFTLDGEYTTVEEGTIWNVPEDENYRLIGGEMRLENDELGWLEISNETLNEHFKIVRLKFYEFSTSEFAYYALIGAETEEKAIEYYKEVVADIEEEDRTPKEITRYEAKKKLMFSLKNWNDKLQAHEDFEKSISTNEPYLILIDSCLV